MNLIEKEVIEGLKQDERDAWCPDLAKVLSTAGFVDEKVYLRFGELPVGERSVAYRDVKEVFYGVDGRVFRGADLPSHEGGICCFAGQLTCQGHYVLKTNTTKLKAMLSVVVLESRPAFYLRGRVIGQGGDGEPLLAKESIRAEPVPKKSIIAVQPMRSLLEYYNARRSGMFPDRHPDYLALLEAGNRREGGRPKVEG